MIRSKTELTVPASFMSTVTQRTIPEVRPVCRKNEAQAQGAVYDDQD